MADMQFDEVRINEWKQDIDTEIEQVSRLLNEVWDELTRDPIEGDTVLKTIYDMGTKLESLWKDLNSTFKKVQEVATSMFQKFMRAISETAEKVAEATGQMKN